jgi:hypothetical protein
MPAQPCTDGKRMVEPAQKCQDEIIYLQHPTLPKRLKLLRGGVEKTLIRFGYTEITREQYESEDVV